MDTQPNLQNMPSPEQSRGAVSPEQVKATEAMPQSLPQATQNSPAPAKLSAADVAAAIAAVPSVAPAAPASVAPQVPMVADDVDVIEPEWVAKAEDVVLKHQGDPYGEEEAVEDLQREYLQQRYGHAVAKPGNTETK